MILKNLSKDPGIWLLVDCPDALPDMFFDIIHLNRRCNGIFGTKPNTVKAVETILIKYWIGVEADCPCRTDFHANTALGAFFRIHAFGYDHPWGINFYLHLLALNMGLIIKSVERKGRESS